MKITTEHIRDFVLWLAAPPLEGVWSDDEPREIESIHLRPTDEQITMLYAARKALLIMEGVRTNSVERAEDIAACRALFDRMLGQCAYENRPKPNAEVDINKEDIPALGRAATHLVEFAILKKIEALEAERRSQQAWSRRQGRR